MTIVSDKHITAILRFGYSEKWNSPDLDTFLEQMANVLKKENITKYNANNTPLVPVEDCQIDWDQPLLSPVEVLKLIEAYEHQCSDAPNFFPISQAARIVRGIRYKAQRLLPGYAEAESLI